jgi:aarF domain-containing kinase
MSFLFQVAAISEQASDLTGDPNPEKSSSPVWKSFDMHAVVDSTEDLLLFILSEKGHRVRLFLLRDIVEAADVFLQDEVIDCALNWKPQDQRISLFEVLSFVKKISMFVYPGHGKVLMAVELLPVATRVPMSHR